MKNKMLQGLVLGACAAGFMFSCSQTFAAEVSQFVLDEYVVTAGRNSERVFDANANVNVVTRKDIEDNHYQTVSEALRRIPGVVIQNYSATGANYSADKLLINGTSHVIVLIDGMRANTNGSVFSVFQPSELSNMDSIERIEVLKGSASTLYGSDAVGGVINIITRKAVDGKAATKISGTWGSYGKQTYTLYHEGGTKDGFYWNIGAQKDRLKDYKDGAGYKTINDIDSKTYNVKLGKKFGDKADLNVNYSRYLLDYGRPEAAHYPATGFTGDVAEGKKDNERYGVNFKYKFNDKLSNDFSFFSRTSNLDDNTNHPANLWLMREKTTGFTNQLTYVDGNHTVIGGLDYYKDSMNKYQDQYTAAMTGDVSSKAFFLQDKMKLGQLTFTPGIRLTRHSKYGNNTSTSGTLAYDCNDITTVYASYKEFFRSPYMYELYSPSYGSTDLRPEKGNTKEIGINTRVDDKTDFSAHIFRTKSDNLIGFNNATWKYYNAGEETIKGWDVQLTKRFDKNVSLTAAYTHTYIAATSAGENDNRDGSVPKHQYDLTFNYDLDKFTGSINAKGIADCPGTKKNENDVAKSFKGYWLLNAAMNYRPTKEMNIFLRVNNIFDRMYTDMTYDMRTPGGANWYSQPGRNFQVGMEYTF